MVDEERVCCMCGDVGFPDKIFQCSRCCFRLQHSYCSNYYYGDESSTTTLCDWCLSEGRNSSITNNHTNTPRPLIKIKASSSSSSSMNDRHNQRIIEPQHDNQQQQGTNNNIESPRERGTTTNNVARNSGIPSPRNRRYKLLKDVMC